MNEKQESTGGFFAMTVARPVALSVIFLTLILVGILSYLRIPLQLLPSGLSPPSLMVWIGNPGASARENEERIARPVEEQLRTLTGIEELISRSSEGDVLFTVEFDGNVDMDLAKAEVRDRLERARPLMPSTAENAFMWSESADDMPITFFGILVRGDPEQRDYLVEEHIKPRLDAVPGIGKVDLFGMLQDSVRILLDEEKVAAAGLDLGGLIQRLSSDNFAMPMGDVDDGGSKILLRSDMRFQSLEEIENYPLPGGLRLKDVGEVARVKSVGDSLSRIDGGFAYYGIATKDSQSNVVEVSHNFQATLDELEEDPALHGNMSSMVFFLQGELIEDALGQLRETAMWGGALALLVLFVFLRRIRLTLCVALCIPISVLMALMFENITGGSFNILTMTGITLGIGMLVDNAVVVVENIAREHREGRSGRAAAVLGSRQIALAITLATLTTVAVFMPLIFMTDNPIVRAIFGGMGIPLSVSLMASLIVAIVFLPVITARLLGERPRAVESLAGVIAPVMRLPVRGVAYLVALLRLVWFLALRGIFRLNRVGVTLLAPLRWPIVIGIVALVAWKITTLATTPIPHSTLDEFGVGVGTPTAAIFPTAISGLLWVAVPGILLAIFGLKRWRDRPRVPPARPKSFVPAGESLVEMTISLNHSLVAWTLQHRLLASFLAFLAFVSIVLPQSLMEVTAFGQETHQDSVEFGVDFNDDFTLSESADEVAIYEEFLEEKKEAYGFAHWSNRFDENSANLTMHFEGQRTEEEFQELEKTVQRDLPRIPGHTLRFYDRERTNDRDRRFAVFTLHGPDSSELEELGARAIEILKNVPGLGNVSSQLESAPEQVRVEVDRERASGLAVSTESIQQTISYILAGFPLPRFQEQGREVPLLIEYDEEDVAGLPTLRDMSVFSENGMIPLSSVAELSFTKGTNYIRRKNGKISFMIWSEVDDPLKIIPITQAGYAALSHLELPRGYSVGTEDSALVRQEEEFAELQKAFLLSVVLIFLLMGILFESVVLPFSVLFTIPFAITGAYWTLFITGTPMDTMGYIGMIILAGVVVNNGIVLIDRIHRLRGAGTTRSEAVITGCGQRVRPVLMTALTTVCGLFPMMITAPPSNGIDYRALATIVAGGLVASTFFTLWVVPLAYTVLDDFARILGERWRWWVRRPVQTAGEPGEDPLAPEPGAVASVGVASVESGA